ncbi:MAG: hypothetical protein AVDCRST_MAG67-978, partial [uncultured Solirubrobacteraceae bacterium]
GASDLHRPPRAARLRGGRPAATARRALRRRGRDAAARRPARPPGDARRARAIDPPAGVRRLLVLARDRARERADVRRGRAVPARRRRPGRRPRLRVRLGLLGARLRHRGSHRCDRRGVRRARHGSPRRDHPGGQPRVAPRAREARLPRARPAPRVGRRADLLHAAAPRCDRM